MLLVRWPTCKRQHPWSTCCCPWELQSFSSMVLQADGRQTGYRCCVLLSGPTCCGAGPCVKLAAFRSSGLCMVDARPPRTCLCRGRGACLPAPARSAETTAGLPAVRALPTVPRRPPSPALHHAQPGSVEGQLGALRRMCFGDLGFVEQLDALDDDECSMCAPNPPPPLPPHLHPICPACLRRQPRPLRYPAGSSADDLAAAPDDSTRVQKHLLAKRLGSIGCGLVKTPLSRHAQHPCCVWPQSPWKKGVLACAARRAGNGA